MVARLAHNQEVVGSSPTPATIFFGFKVVANPVMATKPSTRWGRFCGSEDVRPLKQLADLLGQPQVHIDPPPYHAGVFQVWIREDGVFIHASLLRKWRRRQFYRWFAETQELSPRSFLMN